METKNRTRFLVQAGLIAAAYAAATYLCALWGLAYGEVQFRFSEALMVLALFTPAAIPGLTIVCVIANLGSRFGLIDIVCGSVATLIAVIGMYLVRDWKVRIGRERINLIAPMLPVLSNAIIVGLEISFFMPEGLTWAGFAAAAVSVGIGELVICYGLGIPLSILLDHLPVLKTGKK